MFPKPTADPVAAKINVQRLDQVPCIDFLSSDILIIDLYRVRVGIHPIGKDYHKTNAQDNAYFIEKDFVGIIK
tara:strand:- start:996 stop:1214 length:219 start_codon:yes stop_codon:yes gene_type:complete